MHELDDEPVTRAGSTDQPEGDAVPPVTRPPGTRTLRLRGAVALLVAGTYLWAAVHVADSALPTNSFTPPGARPDATRQLAPEGWAFFTRNPREADLAGWADPRRVGVWVPIASRAHASAKNAFGLKRHDGAQSIEMGLVYSAALEKKASWHNCPPGEVGDLATTVTMCLQNAAPVVVENQTPRALICGAFGISRQQPLPWAWASEGVDEQMPAQAMRIEVRCVDTTY